MAGEMIKNFPNAPDLFPKHYDNVNEVINASDMNNVQDAVTETQDYVLKNVGGLAAHLADYVKHAGYGADTGTANAKIVTLDPAPTAYVEGMAIVFKNKTLSTGAATINVNGLGNKTILKSNGNELSGGNLKAGIVYTLRYNGTAFILQGEGGEYGNATAAQVLAPNTFGTENGVIPGTMVNRGKPTLRPGDILLSGYYDTNTITTQPNGQQDYTTPGTYNWIAPTGVTSIIAVIVGGGGGGGDRTGSGSGGGGGSGGIFIDRIPVTPGTSYTVVVGIGGLFKYNSNGDGQSGGQSSFSNKVASGGQGGKLDGTGGLGGTGGGLGGNGGNGVRYVGGNGLGLYGNGGKGDELTVAGTNGTNGKVSIIW